MQFHHLMSPALSFLSTRALDLTHLFHFSLPECLSHHCMRWKKSTNLIKVRGMRHANNTIRNPCNYLLHLLDTHKRSAVGLSWGLKGHKKTYYQSNFPLSPWAKQSVWEAHALFILAEIEKKGGVHLWLSKEWENCLRGADVASFHNLFCLINNAAWNQ